MGRMGREAGRGRRPGGALALLLSAACFALAAVPARAADDVWAQAYRGTLGPYRIGAEMDVRNRTEFAGAHYFYAARSDDIPLAGSLAGGELVLTEKGGGTFRLRFVDHGRSGPDLTFFTSTGLVGTWTRGGVSYPVVLRGDSSIPKSDGPRYADVTEAPDGTFEAMVARFVRGVASGDRAGAASAVHFPLRVNRPGGRPLFVRDRAQLLARWSEVFPPAYVARISTVATHELFTHEGQAMVGDGEAWFDARGAVSINPPITR